jgi:asparagine synthase (glutamine-hydrolysing)
MCGISGLIDPSAVGGSSGGNSARASAGGSDRLIRVVNGAMAHRGPDADGFFVEGEVALGHRRLSILDLSTAANQPFYDASGRYVMVFNGEIYNFAEIRAQMTDYPYKTHGDTEVIIAAYAKWGAACLNLLKGMFALAIWDREERSLFMARDRFGVKPLYYYHDGDRLLFASEIRAILASGWVPRKINRAALMDYLKYQSIISPLTLVEGILQLPAGTWMKIKGGKAEQQVYWDISLQKKDIGTRDIPTIQKNIKELLYRSVERRLVSDVPLGAFLSGGIDSSAVVAIMSEVNKGATHAFTIAFEEKDYNELPYAEQVARKFGVHHSTVLLRSHDFLDRLPEALDSMDTPSGDGLNTYVVSGAIRRNGITVALSGIGGDELFAGYPLFTQFQSVKRKEAMFNHTRGLRKALAALLPSSDQRQAKWKGILSADRADIADIYPVLRQIQSPHTLKKLLRGGGRGSVENGEAGRAGGAEGLRSSYTLEDQLKGKQAAIEAFDPLSQVSIADYLGYTQSVLLKDADQMSMAVSLEIREPFFDHDLVEYVLNVPDEIKQPVFPKKLLIDSLGGLLPDEIVFRKKQGFVLPYDIWLRTELRPFCTGSMKSLAARGYFSEKALMKYWDDYLNKRSNIRWTDVWIFIVLEHWLNKNGME